MIFVRSSSAGGGSRVKGNWRKMSSRQVNFVAFCTRLTQWASTSSPDVKAAVFRTPRGVLALHQAHMLVRAADVAFPSLRGVTSPRTAYPGVRGANAHLPRQGGADAPLPLVVPQVDGDGNTRGGIRLPDIAVPLATHTGWIYRNAKIGGTEQFVPLNGAYVPFARTKAERDAAGDPRPSVEERYQSREHYLKLVEEAAASLVKDGYLLADDVARIVRRAGDHWDFVTLRSTTTARAE